MKSRLLVSLVLGLLGTSASADIVRSHSFGVTQDGTADAWTAVCSIDADGVDPKVAYWGEVFIQFSNPEETTTLLQTFYYLSPMARTFVEESPGNYRVEAKTTGKGISVSFQATRYGPLWIQNNNVFTCRAGIVEQDTDQVIHAARGNELVYGPVR